VPPQESPALLIATFAVLLRMLIFVFLIFAFRRQFRYASLAFGALLRCPLSGADGILPGACGRLGVARRGSSRLWRWQRQRRLNAAILNLCV
jgi:hypothetical protein